MTIPARNWLFVLAGTLAGFLSGLMSPLVFGVRGAILGAALSIGALFLNPRRKDPDGRGWGPWAAAGLALAVGAAAFAAIWLWQVICPINAKNDEIGLLYFLPLPALAACLIYPLALFQFYREWQAGRRRAWAWFAAAPLLGAMARSLGRYGIQAFPHNLFVGAVPFVLLWLLAVLIADPAWTKRRWDRCSKPGPGETGPTR